MPDRAKARRLFATIGLSLSFFIQGLIYAVRGPILMDLAKFAGSNSLANISLIFPSSAVGLVLGSVACRFLHDSPRSPRLLAPSYSISLVLGSLSAMAVALFPGSVVLICVAFMLQGFALGPLKDGGTIIAHNMGAGAEKGKEDKILNICLIFYFGGCFAAPLIARPYLIPLNEEIEIVSIVSNGTFEGVDITEISNVDDLYYTVGGLAAAIFVVFVATYLVCGRRVENQEDSEGASVENGGGIEETQTDTSGSEETVDTRPSLRQRPVLTYPNRVLIYALISASIFLLSAVAVSLGTFITPFAVIGEIGLNKSDACKSAAVFYFSQLFGHMLMTIFQNNGMKPTYIVTFGLSCCSCGALLCVFAGSTHRQALSIAAVLLGIGTSDLIPICVKWVRRWRGLDMFGAAGVTFAHLGAELGTFLVGQFIEEYPDVLMWIVFGGVCGVISGMTLIVFLARRCKQEDLEVEEEESGAITEVSNECDSVPSNQEER